MQIIQNKVQFVKIDVLQGAERGIFLKFAAIASEAKPIVIVYICNTNMNKEIKTPHNTEKEVWNNPKIEVVELDVTDIIATSNTQSYEKEEYNPWG